jgi:hypothetical protein
MPPAMAGTSDLGDVAVVGGEIEEVAEDVKDCDGEWKFLVAKPGLLKISQRFVRALKHE